MTVIIEYLTQTDAAKVLKKFGIPPKRLSTISKDEAHLCRGQFIYRQEEIERLIESNQRTNADIINNAQYTPKISSKGQ